MPREKQRIKKLILYIGLTKAGKNMMVSCFIKKDNKKIFLLSV